MLSSAFLISKLIFPVYLITDMWTTTLTATSSRRAVEQQIVETVCKRVCLFVCVCVCLCRYTSRWLPQVQGDDDVDSSNFSLTRESVRFINPGGFRRRQVGG